MQRAKLLNQRIWILVHFTGLIVEHKARHISEFHMINNTAHMNIELAGIEGEQTACLLQYVQIDALV